MYKFSKFLGITAGILATISIASCSNEMEPNLSQTPVSNSVLVKAPKVTAWSGEEVFGQNHSTRASEISAPAAVTSQEIAAAKEYFNQKDNWSPASGGQDVDITSLYGWNNYYAQEVVTGNEIPKEVAAFVGTNREVISNIAVWNIDADEVLKLLNTDEYFTSSAKVELDLTGTEPVVGHALKDFSFETTGYDINNTYYENIRSAGHKGQYYMSENYRIATLDGHEDAVYVAFYGYTNQNNGFWDRIIKITKVDLPEVDEPETPEVGDDQNNGDVEGEKINHDNEVEVNLSVLDLHDNYSVEDLATKLSIHVRYAKDVTVRIPVPTETLVPADDLNIVLAHTELLESYGKENKATFEINGNTVELTVAFQPCTDCAGHEYGTEIVVSTKGINKDVIEYCMQNNGDGINFEIINYYQWNIVDENGDATRTKPTVEDIEKLRYEWLDFTTVEFGYDNGTWNAYTNITDYPYYYINAFNDDRDRENPIGTLNQWDCIVRVIGNQADAYEYSYEGLHLNGASWNIIYVRNDIFGTELQDDAHTDHAPAPAPVY